MLFITDTAGVPSVAKMVKLDRALEQNRDTGATTTVTGRPTWRCGGQRPETGTSGGQTTTLGLPMADKPVPADYNGDRKTDLAVWRPATGTWYVGGSAPPPMGRPRRHPVPGDYNGDGKTDLAVWRPSTGTWHIRGISNLCYWGVFTDMPVPADYNGDGKTDLAVWRPSTGTWYVRGLSTTAFGVSTDTPVPADYNGDGKTDLAVWRPSTGTWHIQGLSPVSWGVR